MESFIFFCQVALIFAALTILLGVAETLVFFTKKLLRPTGKRLSRPFYIYQGEYPMSNEDRISYWRGRSNYHV